MPDKDTPESIAQECFQAINNQSKPIFVAITGDSGSGKSYYSRLIRNIFEEKGISYSYLDHDNFLISRKDREPLKEKFYAEGEFAGKSHWEILENWFRMDEYDRVISDLRAGKATTFFPYKRELGGPDANPVTVKPNDVVIFDTTMQTEKMDFVILIDVSPENIMQRKLERDKDIRTPEQIIEMQTKVQGYCWQRTRPKDANIIIDNNDFANPLIVKK